MKWAYYNENDSQKAAWIRELMKAGVVAKGEVDERSIQDVQSGDLRGFAQCHFFAGIAVWSYALRLAGWRDDQTVWTGSCPCPSFSAAGKGQGFDDPRHLWPDWFRLIRQCRPPVIFGEQSDDAIEYGWLDLVQANLEAEDYAVGKAVLGSCSMGSPDMRLRLYFVAHTEKSQVRSRSGEIHSRSRENVSSRSGDGYSALRMGESHRERLAQRQQATKIIGYRHPAFPTDGDGGLAHRNGGRQPVHGNESGNASEQRRNGRRPIKEGFPKRPTRGSQSRYSNVGWMGHSASNGRQEHLWGTRAREESGTESAKYVDGFWADADWILRRKGNGEGAEWCPIEPGTFPLAHGSPARVLRLRGYGDAINAQVAKAFIEAYREARAIK